MGYGDEILAAGQAQRLYDADPSRRVGIFDIIGHPRWHPIWEGNPIIAPPNAIARGEDVQTLVSAPHARPYIIYPFTAQTGWTFNTAFRARDHIARIYLSTAERALGEATRARVGPYVLIEPYTKHANLRWPIEYWQTLVQRHPDLVFVQHTHADSTVLAGVQPVPATFRQACGLIASARLYLRSESGLVHAAAALGIPTITLWGGCMDWDVLGGYPLQTGLLNYTDGSPCGQWEPCAHCEASMAGIPVERVSAAILASLWGETRRTCYPTH